jgi:hypothetical protein
MRFFSMSAMYGAVKAMAEERRIPYQSLMNSYLVDCATSKRKPKWA